jgi:hypothetical protein
MVVYNVRKIGPWSNKIKQMWKQNTEDTQYNRDTDLCDSPSVVDPDLCRNTMKYINTHKRRDAAEIRLHFINNK